MLVTSQVWLMELSRDCPGPKYHQHAEIGFDKEVRTADLAMYTSGLVKVWAAALVEFLEAVRYDPSSPTPWQNLAVLYHKQGVSTVQGLAQCASKEAAVEISRTASHALGEADNAWRKVMELVDDQRTK